MLKKLSEEVFTNNLTPGENLLLKLNNYNENDIEEKFPDLKGVPELYDFIKSMPILKNTEKAVEKIKDHISKNHKIRVISDYDCDRHSFDSYICVST